MKIKDWLIIAAVFYIGYRMGKEKQGTPQSQPVKPEIGPTTEGQANPPGLNRNFPRLGRIKVQTV